MRGVFCGFNLDLNGSVTIDREHFGGLYVFEQKLKKPLKLNKIVFYWIFCEICKKLDNIRPKFIKA